MDCSMPGFSVYHQHSELSQTHVHWVSDAIQPSQPLLSPSVPAFNLSQHQDVFQWVSSSHHVAKVLELQPQHQTFQWMLRTSFRTHWFDLLAVQETLKSLIQHHNSKASILWHSSFFMIQPSHLFMTTEKTKTLTRWTFVGKVMSLLFNMMSIFVIAFLSRSTHLLISWLQSPSEVILLPKKRKSVTVPIVSPSICHKVMGLDAMILVLWILSFKPAFSLSSFTFIKRFFSSSSLSAIRVVSSAYLKLLMVLPAILIPACTLSSPAAFRLMHSACKSTKQGDHIQPCQSPFSIWIQSVSLCLVLTVAS